VSGPHASERASARSARGHLLLAIVAGGTFLTPINSTMIVVALPALMTAFGVGVAGASWIVTLYLVTMASLQPVAGRLGDSYGHRRLFVAGCVGLGGASVACALARTFPLLIAFRALQGVCASIVNPNGSAIIQHAFVPDVRGRAFGWLAACMTLGAAIGPAVGGLLVDQFGWASIFWVNLPILAVVIPLAIRWLPETARQDGRGFDAGGAVLLSLTLATGVVALSRLSRGALAVLAVVAAGVVLGAVLYAWERRHANPIVDVRLFRHPAFAGASVAVLLTNLVMYTTLLLVPLFMVGVQGRGPREVGGVLVIYSSMMAALSPVGGFVSDRLGPAVPVVGGTVLLLAGTGLLLRAHADTSLLGLIAPLAVGAAGVGLQMGAEQSAALGSAPAGMSGVAGGIWATGRYLGAILGAVLLGVIVEGTLDPAGFRQVLYVAAAAGFVLLPVGTLLRFSGRALGLLAVTGPAPSGATTVPRADEGIT
jgi:EmrB/QacA subfamily drug resistance transporter